MKAKRFISVVLALFLLIQPLCALGEAVPAPVNPPKNPTVPVLSAEEAAYAERMKEAFQITAEYEETDWDSILEAKITVTWPGTGNIKTAENVNVHIAASDGLYMAAGMETIPLGNMTAGESRSFAISLAYDRQIEKKKDEPEPKLTVTAYAGNTDYTRYTAVLDGMTEPRALVLGWEWTDIGPRAVQTDLAMMEDIFSQSYYNGRKFEVDGGFNEATFEESISRIAGWDENENDVTYVYINAHGPLIEGEPIPAFEAGTSDLSVWIDGTEYTNAIYVTYEKLLSYLDEMLDGRVVIITEICFSGQLLDVAASMGVDVEKFSIMTAASANQPSNLWGDEIDVLKLDMPFSYGWFTNDLCDLLDAGYAKDANGVVTVGAAYNYLHDELSALQSRINTALNDQNDEDLHPSNISGLNDIFDTLDVWGERLWSLFDFEGKNILLLLDEIEPLELVKQSYLLAKDMMDPMFGGNNKTLLYCSDPTYDDEKRKLVLVEEKLELFSPVELYYQYLREEVVPEIGVAAINTEVRGDEGYDEEHWSRLNSTVGGLLSAAVCDLDKNGTPDMLTIEIDPLQEMEIELLNRYFSVDLKLYQIVDGEVMMNDSVEDVVFVNERNRTCSLQTNFRLTEYEGQLMLECWASFTDGLSYNSGMNAFYGFKDGFFTDPPARPSAYDFDYFTEDGRAYSASLTSYEIGYQPNGVFRAVNHGEFIAHITYIPYFYPHHKGYVYYAGGITNLEEYLNEYEEEDYFAPLKYVSQPLPTPEPEVAAADVRKAEVKAAVERATEPYLEEMEIARFRCSVSCKKDGDLSQIMISIGQTSAGAINTSLLKELCVSLVSAEELGLSADVVSMVEGFEFKKGKSETAGLVEIAMNMKPSGEFVVTITNDRARK